jgi:hypothetical protein
MSDSEAPARWLYSPRWIASRPGPEGRTVVEAPAFSELVAKIAWLEGRSAWELVAAPPGFAHGQEEASQ